MYKIFQNLILIIFLLFIQISCWLDNSSIKSNNKGCTNSNACNYDLLAIEDDNSCWYANENCTCDDPPNSLSDCLGYCDLDTSNDPVQDQYGNCEETVIGGCIDTLFCNFDSTATHDDGSCAVNLLQFGGAASGLDCEGNCNGYARADGCGKCVGGNTQFGDSWRMEIKMVATLKNEFGIIVVPKDTNSIIIGASIHALNGWNAYEGPCLHTEDNICYSDAIYNDISINPDNPYNYIKFYLPHDDWEDEVPFNITNFIQDIKFNDLHSLSFDGLSWIAEVESIPNSNIIESIFFQFINLENILSSIIIVEVNGNIYHLNDENILEVAFESQEVFQVKFNISGICFEY